MSFEIRSRDLMARICSLKTKNGSIETPALLPVVNPTNMTIPSNELIDEFKLRAITTNAYIIKRNLENQAIEQGVHKLLNFPYTILTDSGAYQILVYGKVGITPEEIVKFQEAIDTDIAVILDIPTQWQAKRSYAELTVEETLKRAKISLQSITRDDILWVGPIQGGRYLDLVEYSAKQMGELPFQIHALGSPTQVMEQYYFDVLVNMIVSAKRNMPIDRPLHLFGAGHPFMFAFAVALGCDTFDSAAYALYAREQRYMTESGTIKLDQLEYFPCNCNVCSKYQPKELKETPFEMRVKLLAKHNLHTCLEEIQRIKQAIKEGRLWELLELRARGHPSLLQALRELDKHKELMEEYSPVSKERGLFYFGSTGLARPEVIRHKKRLLERYVPPMDSEVLILLPQTKTKPFHRSREIKRVLNKIHHLMGEKAFKLHVCIMAAPFGVVPIEIDELYPLSQFEIALPTDDETLDYVSKQVAEYVATHKYRVVILHNDPKLMGSSVLNECKKTCEALGIKFLASPTDDKPWGKNAINGLIEIVSGIFKNGLEYQ